MAYHNSSAAAVWRPVVTVAVTSITVTSTYYLYHYVSKYGWEGTFWYIWEGDPYPPNVRDYFHALDDIQEMLQQEQVMLDRLEETYQRAKLDCVDEAADDTINDAWNANILAAKNTNGNFNLERTLAMLSYNLDQCAAQVDAVPSKQHHDLKPRKKALSNQIEQMMQRADVFMGHYQDGQKQQKTI